MWAPRGPEFRVEADSLPVFLDAWEFPRWRPKRTGIQSCEQYMRLIRQVYRETGHLADEALEPWEVSSPPWEDIMRWRDSPDKGGLARLESHRKALRWLAAYWGLTEQTMPAFLTSTWAHARAVRSAKQTGAWRVRERFLRLPTHAARLLSAHPFETRLERTDQYNSLKERKQARYLDRMWRALIHLGLYTGPRPAEFATLRLGNIDWEDAFIRGWEQPKKMGKPRDVAIPERWVVEGDGRQGPCLERYVKNVRSEVTDDVTPSSHVFLTFAGKPYTPRSIRNLVSDGIHEALGIRNVSAHALRRACATWRYIHGWAVEDIASLLDDTPSVVEGSYIDVTHVKTRGRKRTRSRERYPTVDWIRPEGQKEPAAKAAAGRTQGRGEIRRDPPKKGASTISPQTLGVPPRRWGGTQSSYPAQRQDTEAQSEK